MKYMYSVRYIDEDQRWIFLSSDDEWDFEEPDSFVFLLSKIRDRFSGHILEYGELSYIIPEDGLGLIYQWDTLFGITVIYPKTVQSETVIDFLLSINSTQ